MHVVVNVDGGSRGNPGPAAAAAVVSDTDGHMLTELSRFIGDATNNVAEYEAVLLGLEIAQEVGATSIEIINDSELVAKQINGLYKVKNSVMKEYFLQVIAALRGFEKWSIRSVRRENNQEADKLVNIELDKNVKLKNNN